MEFWGSTVNPRMPVASVRGPSGQDTVGTQEGAGVCNSPEDRKLPLCVSHSGILLAFSRLAGAQQVQFCLRPSCWVYVCWVLSETRWWVEAELVLPMQLGGLWAASAPSGQAVCWQRL